MDQKKRQALTRVLDFVCDGAGTKGLKKKDMEIARNLQQSCREWLSDESVQGIAVGTKLVSYNDTQKPCICVYVDKKRPHDQVKNPAPKFIQLEDGTEFPLDVEETGKIMPHNLLENRRRPIHASVSVACIEQAPGTLGIIVHSTRAPGKRYILSCSHVLKPFVTEQNSMVLQPALADGGQANSRFEVAKYSGSIPIQFSNSGYPNRFDAAIAELREDIPFRTDIPYIGAIQGVTGTVAEGRTIRIVGKKSNFSSGTILRKDFRLRLPYTDKNGNQFYAGFRGVTLCTGYGQPGDSGAVVVTSDNKLTGIHFAGSYTHSVFYPILPVLNYFGVWPVSDFTLNDDIQQNQAGTELQPSLDISALTQSHNIFDSAYWRLTPKGLEIDGNIESSAGKLTTVPGVIAKFDRQIKLASREFDVPYELILASICTESGGNVNARREEPGYLSDEETPHKVSLGLMQTLLSTARQALNNPYLPSIDLMTPEVSIRAGTAYIKEQHIVTNFDPPIVACAYNAGGVYQNNGKHNRWKMRQYPIGTSKHTDRFIIWFNDCFRYFAGHSSAVPEISYYFILNSNRTN